ncbi:MAG: hypothetical protein ACI9P5_003852, partial [Saprospiraceae bacterium]
GKFTSLHNISNLVNFKLVLLFGKSTQSTKLSE